MHLVGLGRVSLTEQNDEIEDYKAARAEQLDVRTPVPREKAFLSRSDISPFASHLCVPAAAAHYLHCFATRPVAKRPRHVGAVPSFQEQIRASRHAHRFWRRSPKRWSSLVRTARLNSSCRHMGTRKPKKVVSAPITRPDLTARDAPKPKQGRPARLSVPERDGHHTCVFRLQHRAAHNNSTLLWQILRPKCDAISRRCVPPWALLSPP